jgi:hemin uptake protein HemP
MPNSAFGDPGLEPGGEDVPFEGIHRRRSQGKEEAPARRSLRRIGSAELFGEADRIVIEHGGQDYVLLVTRNGRLLLNRWK